MTVQTSPSSSHHGPDSHLDNNWGGGPGTVTKEIYRTQLGGTFYFVSVGALHTPVFDLNPGPSRIVYFDGEWYEIAGDTLSRRP